MSQNTIYTNIRVYQYMPIYNNGSNVKMFCFFAMLCQAMTLKAGKFRSGDGVNQVEHFKNNCSIQ
jgi:hypothetical protein